MSKCVLNNLLPSKFDQAKVNLFSLATESRFRVAEPSLGQDGLKKENRAGLSSRLWFGGATCVHTRAMAERQSWQEQQSLCKHFQVEFHSHKRTRNCAKAQSHEKIAAVGNWLSKPFKDANALSPRKLCRTEMKNRPVQSDTPSSAA